MKTKISILLPLYNGRRYLEYSLKSILNQTYSNFEIIITDDGSMDNGYDHILTEFQDSRIIVLKQENKGKNAALNNSLKYSTAEYITIFDQDDYLNKYYLEIIADAILHTNSDCILTKAEIVYKYCQENFECTYTHEASQMLNYNEVIHLYLNDKTINMYLWNKVFKREIFDSFEFPSDLLLDDISSTHILLGKCVSFTKVNTAKYFHYIQLNSMASRNSSQLYIEQLLIIYMRRLEHFKREQINSMNLTLITNDTIRKVLFIHLKLNAFYNSKLSVLSSKFLSDTLNSIEKNHFSSNKKILLFTKFFLNSSLMYKNKLYLNLAKLLITINHFYKKSLGLMSHFFNIILNPC